MTVRSAAHAPQLAAIEGLAAALIADISGKSSKNCGKRAKNFLHYAVPRGIILR